MANAIFVAGTPYLLFPLPLTFLPPLNVTFGTGNATEHALGQQLRAGLQTKPRRAGRIACVLSLLNFPDPLDSLRFL
jgi:hypothetical protein